ncbi:hypothetical protein BDF20DRAFT_878641 [Mycotypha africana]|uniref:uncharacterized protein n=1 Tax=Mycotypha africana TaxID=64632 RepID=UPI0023012ED2|nr:uncharacterized protein BDF20DRAFT_878641 [Mycotypha africana]KAI8975435.1 hypothetical protein BDF20DRAFT_878641 [Mycotypha africana]
MDYTSFNFEDNGDLFKLNTDTVNNDTNNIDSTANVNFVNQPHSSTTSESHSSSVDFFNFLDATATSDGNNSINNQNMITAFSSVPQLSPDAQQDGNIGTYTDSSVLSGHNPEYTMSPLQIATQQNSIVVQQQQIQTPSEEQTFQHQFHTPLQHPLSNPISHTPTTFDDLLDDDEFFTPLVSPAIAPSYDHQFQFVNTPNMTATTPAAAAAAINVFSPLSSPALNPSNTNIQSHNFLNQNVNSTLLDQNTLQQKLAFIERQQQQLRSMHQQIRQSSVSSATVADTTTANTSTPTVPTGSGTATNNNKRKSMHNSPRSFTAPSNNKQLASSPLALKPRNAMSNKSAAIAPATPSLLMKLGSGGGGVANTINHAASNSLSPLAQSAITMPTTVTSPMSLPSSTPTSALPANVMSSSAAVDNMSSLPAAMLSEPPKSAPLLPTNPKIPKQKSNATTTKRRRISSNTSISKIPASTATFSSPGLSPNPSHVQFSPLGPRPTGSNVTNMHHSPRTLKPLISPSLQPNGKRLSTIEEETARALLTTKSNYENLKEGTAKHLGIDFNTTIQSGIENRRSAHKAAEQKRRDTLKQSFDSLRVELIDAFLEDDLTEDVDEQIGIGKNDEDEADEFEEKKEEEEQGNKNEGSRLKDNSNNKEKKVTEIDKIEATVTIVNDDGTEEDGNKEDPQPVTKKKKLTIEEQRLEKEKEVKQMSKVVLLQHSYEYILRLKNDKKRKDEKLKRAVDELRLLRKQLGLPEVTEDEKLERERELKDIRERREARRKQQQLQLEQQKAKDKEAQAIAAAAATNTCSSLEDKEKGKQKE